jgi:hypothetical protein
VTATVGNVSLSKPWAWMRFVLFPAEARGLRIQVTRRRITSKGRERWENSTFARMLISSRKGWACGGKPRIAAAARLDSIVTVASAVTGRRLPEADAISAQRLFLDRSLVFGTPDGCCLVASPLERPFGT